MNNGNYWTHNVAYHEWILRHISPTDSVLDVGSGDGLLLEKLSTMCRICVGVEPHAKSAERAEKRLENIKNAAVRAVTLDGFQSDEKFDAVIFAASIHHMDMEKALIKAKSHLVHGGKILIIGCAKPKGIGDFAVDALRVIPAKIGSILHGERDGGEIGVPTQGPELSLREIKNIVKRELPRAKIRRGLYYRYLLSWENK